MGSKKKFVTLLLSLLMFAGVLFGLTACDTNLLGCMHDYKEATCTTPKTCTLCEQTEGEALGHDMKDATCTDPKHCTRCDLTEGEALGHTWTEATCASPKTCSVCQATEGEALAHVGGTATCQKKAECTLCGEEYGEFAAHVFNQKNKAEKYLSANATCGEAATYYYSCVCGEKGSATFTDGESLGHDFENGAWISTDGQKHWKKCNRCDAEDTANKVDHEYANACDTACDTCGHVRTIEHDYTNLQKSATEHWYICSVCDEEKPNSRTAHTGGTANCTEAKKCEVCQQSYGEALGHDFENGPWVNVDGDQHWKKCNRCDAEDTDNKKNHVYANACDTLCDVCDHERTIEHNYTDLQKSETEHWYICSVCDVEKPNSRTAHTGGTATCTEAKKCEVCQQAYGEVPGHTWVDATCTTSKTCSECDATEGVANGHTWVDATCTTPKTCSVCDATEGVANGHDFENDTWISTDEEKHWKKCANCDVEDTENKVVHDYKNHVSNGNNQHEATCVCGRVDAQDCTGGKATCLTKATCEVCNTLYGDLGEHSWSAATCETAKTCKLCGETEGEALSHDYKEATCTAPKTCKRCNKTEGNALSHAWVEATCTEVKHCSVCDATEGGFAEHVGGTATCNSLKICEVCNKSYGTHAAHDYSGKKIENAYLASPATCEDKATYYYVCATCGEKGAETFEEGEALGHAYGDWISENNAHYHVCANDGTHVERFDCGGGTATCEKPATCSVCGNEYGKALGHAYGEWEKVTAATCDENGLEKSVCANCDDEKTRVIPATGHSYTVAITKPTCTEKGYSTHTCSACNDVKVDSYVDEEEHSWNIDAPTCTEDKVCAKCGTTFAKRGHNYALKNSVAATCTTPRKDTYECTRCLESSYEDEVGTPIAHDVAGVTPTLTLVEGKTCEYVQHFECKACHGDVIGQTVTNHVKYTAEITTAATCTTEGVKTLTCSGCDETKTEKIEIDDVLGHNWTEGTAENGKRTDTCANCGETKTVAVVSSTDKTNVSDLKDTELSLESGANITLGNAADAIGDKEVTISAGTLTDEDKADLGLSEEELAQVGDNKIYNFVINDGTNDITDFGENGFITVTLPYTLEDGEDVDNIAVWYIDENGKLTSIEATYNNGFVTFQTNHFSYYTVTRLTPAERCALYGHNFRNKEVAETCTTDGYTLRFCIRCGHSQKEAGAKATGHSYQSQVTAATCTTAGKEVHTCTVCQHSYTVIIPATNHKWEKAEEVAATCVAPGFVKYTCANDCGEEYTETEAQLAHSMVETTVEATCTTGGYTLYACENCEYSYKDKEVNALGHDYHPQFTWNENHTRVDLVMVCSHDEEETHPVHYENLSFDVRNTLPSCNSYGKIEFIVRITFNGEIFEDIQEVPYADSFAHRYNRTWSYDQKTHWHACAMCEAKGDEAAHEYGEGVVTKRATCYAEGEMAYTCACGYVKTEIISKTDDHNYAEGVWAYDELTHYNECTLCGAHCNEKEHTLNNGTVISEATCSANGEIRFKCTACRYTETQTIPATKEHIYVDGACEYCGKLEFDCDHETLHEDVIDLNEYGLCLKKIDILTCECGEVVRLADIEAVMSTCDIETEDEDYVQNPDGSITAKATGVCTICGVKIIAEAEMVEENCGMQATYIITLIVGNETVLQNAIGEIREEYHNEERVKIDFSEYTPCGGVMTVYKCRDCGKLVGIADGGPNCNVEGSMTEGSYVDENGIEHMTMHAECPDCGLVVDADGYMIANGCEAYIYTRMTITVDGVVVLDVIEEDYDEEHDYEQTIEFDGDTCQEGYTIRYTCANCGQSHTEKRTEHRYEEQIIDLSKVSTCGGQIYASKCSVCGLVGSVKMDVACEPTEEPEITEEVDGNGVVYQVMQFTCPNCGLTFVMKEWSVQEGCIAKDFEAMYIYNGEELIAELKQLDYVEGHEFEYTYELMGETCNDGYKVTATCIHCGLVERDYRGGCQYEEAQINLADFGACGGTLVCEKCSICGAIGMISDMEILCDIDMEKDPPITEVVDGNGIVHLVQSIACPTCGLTVTSDMWEVKKSECISEMFMVGTFVINGKEIVRFEENESVSNHQYKEEVTFNNGVDCEEGFTVRRYCTVCSEGDHMGWGGSGHNYVYQEIDLGAHGGCGGFVYVDLCERCGKLGDFPDMEKIGCDMSAMIPEEESGVEDDGDEWAIQKMTCPTCGLVFIAKNWQDTVSVCVEREYIQITISMGETLIADWTMMDEQANHNYETTVEMYGESCYDGYKLVTYCTICQEREEKEYKGHYYDKVEYDLTELGFCGGHISMATCVGCGYVEHANYGYSCSFMTEGVSEEGYEVATCRNCGGARLRKVNISAKDENCNYTQTEEIVLLNRERVEVIRFTRVMHMVQHNYLYEYAFHGESCTDGVDVMITCRDCNYDETRYITQHETMELFNVHSVEGTCANHDFWVSACPCGKNSYVGYNIEGMERNEETGAYTCPTCAFSFSMTASEETDGCYLTRSETYVLTRGDELLYEHTKVTTQGNHTFTLSVSGKQILNVCSVCGVSASYSMDVQTAVLSWNEVEKIYCYDLTVTPEVSGNYVIYSAAREDTFVELYQVIDGNYKYVKENDEGGNEGDFRLEYPLEAGNTYVYRIRFYEGGRSGEIPYVFSQATASETTDCTHNYRTEYYVLPEGVVSCTDGVYRVYVCDNCGKIFNVSMVYEHYGKGQSYELKNYGACEGYIEQNGCACGANGNLYYNVGCLDGNPTREEVEIDGVKHLVETYSCAKCGKVFTVDSYTEETSCETLRHTYITVVINGEEVLNVSGVQRMSEHHDYECTYTFEGEQNCEQGVEVIKTCKKCGKKNTYHYMHHDTCIEERIDLGAMGACGGELLIRQCPCGKEIYVDQNAHCPMGVTQTKNIDEMGVEHTVYTYTCQNNCGFSYTRDVYNTYEGCMRTEYSAYVFTFEGTVVSEYQRTSHYEEHKYEYTFAFDGEENCESGVQICRTCTVCGIENSYHVTHHESFEMERCDLSAYGECGGYLRLMQCPCGEYSHLETEFNWDNHTTNQNIHDDGRLHTVEAYTCNVCDLRLQIDYYTERDASICKEVTYYHAILNVGAEFVADLSYQRKSDSHRYQVNGVLDNGEGSSCNEGVTLYYTCLECGYSYENRYSWHYTYEQTRYDLTAPEYGSAVCLGDAVIVGCACGYEKYVNLESICEFRHHSADVWFTDYVTGSRVTAQNPYGGNVYAHAYQYICAVTDPVQCGYRIRYAEYYRWVDTCRAQRYETWQLGYNDVDGTWAYEFTFARGGIVTVHDYEETNIHENYENGNLKQEGWNYTCTRCGSYYFDKNNYDAEGKRISEERVWENTLDDGQRKYYRNYYEYDENGNQSLSRTEWTEADGTQGWNQSEETYTSYTAVIDGMECSGIEVVSRQTDSNGADYGRSYARVVCEAHDYREYTIYEKSVYEDGSWERWDYTYTFENGCMRTIRYTSSHSEEQTSTDSWHYYHWITVKYPTCTQDGLEQRICRICDYVEQENILQPGHDWCYVEEDLYRCSRCGLENVNGTSGAIILEDLTAELGNGENYVVGYCADTETQFINNVSLMLHTPFVNSDGLLIDQLILDVSNFWEHDEVRAIVFSKSEVDEAIQLALEQSGYTGAYDVRFAFVPVGADGSFDYAITFTDESLGGGELEKPEEGGEAVAPVEPDNGEEVVPEEGDVVEVPKYDEDGNVWSSEY